MRRGTPTTGWLVGHLPKPIAEDPFIGRFSMIFEDVIDSVRARISDFAFCLDPAFAPEELLQWLGGWLGLEVFPSLPEERQRNLVRAAGELYPWRGTARGLQGLVEAVTGAKATVDDGGGVFAEGRSMRNNHHVTVHVASTGGISEVQLREMIANEMPAAGSFELLVGGVGVRDRSTDDQASE